MKSWAEGVLFFLFSVSGATAADNMMKAFPPAGEGMVRYVLNLAKHTDESALKVELLVGKTVLVDARNRYFFAGRIEAQIIAGWGFTRYTVKQVGPMGGTQRAVELDAPKAARFITLSGEPYLVRYNSRLPIVIYVPEGNEVRYRIWSAGVEAKAIDRG